MRRSTNASESEWDRPPTLSAPIEDTIDEAPVVARSPRPITAVRSQMEVKIERPAFQPRARQAADTSTRAAGLLTSATASPGKVRILV